MFASSMSVALSHSRNGSVTVVDVLKNLSSLGRLPNLASFDFDEYLRSIRSNEPHPHFQDPLIVVDPRRIDCIHFAADRLAAIQAFETQTMGTPSKKKKLPEIEELDFLETRSHLYPRTPQKGEKTKLEDQKLKNEESHPLPGNSEDLDGPYSEDIKILKTFAKVESWLNKSANSLLSSVASSESDLSVQDDVALPDSVKKLSEGAKKRVSFPKTNGSALKCLEVLHAKYTFGGDTRFITSFSEDPEKSRYGPASISGFIIDVVPEVISPMSILVGYCQSGCGEFFSFRSLFLVGSKFEMNCPHCDFAWHITCPDCSKDGLKIPLCIYFSFKLYLFCGTSLFEVNVEKKEAEHFLGCTVAEYLNDPEVQVKSLVSLYQSISHGTVTNQSTAVVLNVMLEKVPETRIYLQGTKLKECQFHYKKN